MRSKKQERDLEDGNEKLDVEQSKLYSKFQINFFKDEEKTIFFVTSTTLKLLVQYEIRNLRSVKLTMNLPRARDQWRWREVRCFQ